MTSIIHKKGRTAVLLMILFLAGLFFLLQGISAGTGKPVVYLAGQEFVKNSNRTATYWRDGVAVHLTDGKYDADSNSVFVENGTVYNAGWALRKNSKTGLLVSVAMYWKNTTSVALTDGTVDSVAESVWVVGSDVYVAGYIQGANRGWRFEPPHKKWKEGDYAVAMYWKNGKGIPLTDGLADAFAYSIRVSGKDVYIAGSMLNPDTGLMRAVYWKNGEMVPLSDGKLYTTATSIYVQGNTIVVGGSCEYDRKQPVADAFYWKNGERVTLKGVYGSAVAHTVFISGSDIYVLGYDGGKVTWWKNGRPTHLELNDRYREVYSLFVLGGDVYLAGTARDDERLYAAWWCNGNITRLPKIPDSFLPDVHGMFVTRE